MFIYKASQNQNVAFKRQAKILIVSPNAQARTFKYITLQKRYSRLRQHQSFSVKQSLQCTKTNIVDFGPKFFIFLPSETNSDRFIICLNDNRHKVRWNLKSYVDAQIRVIKPWWVS